MESKPKYLTDDEIAELAKTIRIADPTKDDGAFNSVSRMDALVWLRLMGVKGLNPRSPLSEAEVIERLRIALWDSQRLDYLFSGFTLSTSLKKLKISSFKSWDGWENAHPELRKYAIGLLKLDGYKDAKRLNS
ncbi:hypothetical protein QCA50_019155 [Cerrena zonata]|uniref:Uncharacterized protein n=1 Tax=Cerrena zonata TaxID=2478898 RepID=A0AAW0F9V1_9APHY